MTTRHIPVDTKDMHDGGGYYFDMATGEVVYGPKRSWTRRMGPYPTAQEAAHALEIARARTKEWDEKYAHRPD